MLASVDSYPVSEQTVSHYRIVEKVGEGGMGVVYRAHDDRLNRDVALKFLPAELDKDENARLLLIREARTASALNHPNICTIYDVGEADGKSYIVMEFVHGRSLAEQIPESGLPTETVIRYGEQIADAMAHAHEHGVIHRDLKTPNVIIMPGGRVKVLDFGLAKHMTPGEITLKTQSISTLTSEGAIVGTMHYMAPELFRGEPADARSDIWALGVVLYEMANGKRPFRGRTSYELSSMILHDTRAGAAGKCTGRIAGGDRALPGERAGAALSACERGARRAGSAAYELGGDSGERPAGFGGTACRWDTASAATQCDFGIVGGGSAAGDCGAGMETGGGEVARAAARGCSVHSIAGGAAAGKSYGRPPSRIISRTECATR